jgi:hypothetical protein
MGRFESMNIHWPPVGWPQFAEVNDSSGRAVAKDISKARIFGLQYSIESVPLFKMDTKLFRHDISIDGWQYTILNESIEYPVLTFSVYDRFDLQQTKESFVTDIRSYSTEIPHTRRSVNRAVSAAIFLIRQINLGSVPDVNRVMRTYKLHPNQAFLYREDPQAGAKLKGAFEAGNGLYDPNQRA